MMPRTRTMPSAGAKPRSPTRPKTHKTPRSPTQPKTRTMPRSRTIWMAALALATLAPTSTLDAQERQRPRQPPSRQALERRFEDRVVDMSRRRLDLTDENAERLRTILREGWSARRELREELEAERARFAAAVRDADTSDAEFTRLLNRMQELRRREYELWVAEQRALAEIMTPRQRAMFVQMQMRVNDAVRDVRRRKPEGGGGGGGGRPEGGGGGPDGHSPSGADRPRGR